MITTAPEPISLGTFGCQLDFSFSSDFPKTVMTCPACGEDFVTPLRIEQPAIQSVSIVIFCKACAELSRLWIHQHQGQTYIGWDPRPVEVPSK